MPFPSSLELSLADHPGECATALPPGPHHDALDQAGTLLVARLYRVDDDSECQGAALACIFPGCDLLRTPCNAGNCDALPHRCGTQLDAFFLSMVLNHLDRYRKFYLFLIIRRFLCLVEEVCPSLSMQD